MSYGEDTWCIDSYSPGRVARGSMVVVQALYRRLRTPRGTLRGGPEEQAYGLDLEEYVGDLSSDALLASIPAVVRAELLKDDRVQDVVVTPTIIHTDAGEIELRLDIAGKLSGSLESFALTLGVSRAGVAFIGATT